MINLKEFKELFYPLSSQIFQGKCPLIQFEMVQMDYSWGDANKHNQFESFLNSTQFPH